MMLKRLFIEVFSYAILAHTPHDRSVTCSSFNDILHYFFRNIHVLQSVRDYFTSQERLCCTLPKFRQLFFLQLMLPSMHIFIAKRIKCFKLIQNLALNKLKNQSYFFWIVVDLSHLVVNKGISRCDLNVKSRMKVIVRNTIRYTILQRIPQHSLGYSNTSFYFGRQ